MTDEKKSALVRLYAFGTLTDEESAELARVSLDDPEVFDELWEATDLHELLQDSVVRRRLLRRLEKSDRPWRVAWSWLSLPASRLALAGAIAVVLGILIWRGPSDNRRRGAGDSRPATVVTDSTADLATFFKLPLRTQLDVRIDLHRAPATFHFGEAIQGTIHLQEPAAVFVLRRQSDGQMRIVFPGDLVSSADLLAGETPVVFDAVIPTSELTTQQMVTLRVFALPVGKDLRTQSIEWSKLTGYSVREVTYSVLP